MTGWIADGEAGSAIRAKLNASPHIISAGSLTSLSTKDIVIPSDVGMMELKFINVRVSAGSSVFQALFSEDAGANWLDSYLVADVGDGETAAGQPQNGYLFLNSAACLSDFTANPSTVTPVLGVKGSAIIDPGSSTQKPSIYAESTGFINRNEPDVPYVGGAYEIEWYDSFAVNSSARQNKLRLQTDDPNTKTFTAGLYWLIGYPTPA